MIPTRLELALDRYGSDLTRWPPDLAAEAQAELARSDAFRKALAREGAFDALIRNADPARRVDPAALARVEAMVMAKLPAARRDHAPRWLGWLADALSPDWGWQRSLAAMLVLAAMLGMAAGSALPVPDWTAPSAGATLASKSFYRGDLQ